MLSKGRTAIEGLSGSANGGPTGTGPAPSPILNTCTGLAMFFSGCSPRSSKVTCETTMRFIAHLGRDADPARGRQRLQPRGDVDALTIAVFALDDHLADFDPDPQRDPALVGHVVVGLGHPGLKFECAADRIDRTAELHQDPVAHELDNASAMRAQDGFEHGLAPVLQRRERPGFVRFHQTRISHDIGDHNRRKPVTDAFFGHCDPLGERPS